MSSTVEQLDANNLEMAMEMSAKPPSTLSLFWKEIYNDKLALIGFILFFVLLISVTIGSAIITTPAVTRVNLAHSLLAPSWTAAGRAHGVEGLIFGTDVGGRDVFGYLVIGARNSLFIGFSVSIISIIIGFVIGLISGFYGGHVDNVIQRIVDTWTIMPGLMFIIALITATGNRTIWHMIMYLTIFSWMGRVRQIRARTLQQRNLDYVSASRTLGTYNLVIIYREIVPNLIPIMSANVVLTLAASVGMETGLTMLGFGLEFGTPSIGNLIAYAMEARHLQFGWWLWFPAILSMFILMLCINFVGRAVSRAADPKQRLV